MFVDRFLEENGQTQSPSARKPIFSLRQTVDLRDTFKLGTMIW
jgi:hypothetical protein